MTAVAKASSIYNTFTTHTLSFHLGCHPQLPVSTYSQILVPGISNRIIGTGETDLILYLYTINVFDSPFPGARKPGFP